MKKQRLKSYDLQTKLSITKFSTKTFKKLAIIKIKKLFVTSIIINNNINIK